MLHCLKLYLPVTDLKVAPGVHKEDVDQGSSDCVRVPIGTVSTSCLQLNNFKEE